MWNIFEHWWAALLVALAVQLALAVIHVLRPDSRKLWHILIPLTVLAIGVGVEWLVQTDMEKIKSLVNECLRATANEDIAAIDALLAPGYADSVHNSKAAAMDFCRQWFGRPLISQNKLFSPPEIIITSPTAEINLIVVTHVDPKSEYYDSAKLALIKVRLYLHRTADRKWLIKSAELIEINNQSVKWNQI